MHRRQRFQCPQSSSVIFDCSARVAHWQIFWRVIAAFTSARSNVVFSGRGPTCLYQRVLKSFQRSHTVIPLPP